MEPFRSIDKPDHEPGDGTRPVFLAAKQGNSGGKLP